jgi:hypothetical protein
MEKLLISLLKNTGVSRSSVEEIPKQFADRKPEEGVDYYYYIGPNDAKTRPFCRLMLKIDKVFTEEEINYISDNLNYPVLEFCGSYGCRHSWVRFRGRRISTPPPTQREIRKLINRGIEA